MNFSGRVSRTWLSPRWNSTPDHVTLTPLSPLLMERLNPRAPIVYRMKASTSFLLCKVPWMSQRESSK